MIHESEKAAPELVLRDENDVVVVQSYEGDPDLLPEYWGIPAGIEVTRTSSGILMSHHIEIDESAIRADERERLAKLVDDMTNAYPHSLCRMSNGEILPCEVGSEWLRAQGGEG